LKIKEHAKNILLILLILNVLLLATQYWIISSSGWTKIISLKSLYNFDMLFAHSSSQPRYNSYDGVDEMDFLFLPSYIFFKCEDAKYLNEQRYDSLVKINAAVKASVVNIFKSDGLVGKKTSGTNEFLEILSNPCVFVDFSVSIPGDIYMEYLLISNEGLVINNLSFRYAVFYEDDLSAGLYFYDPYLRAGVKYTADGLDIFEEFSKNVDAGALKVTDSDFVCNYKDNEYISTCADDLSLWPHLLLRQGPSVRKLVENDIFLSDAQGVFKTIASAFSFSTYTINKYPGEDGSLNYVEDFGKLTLNKNGYIVFDASKNGGISVAPYMPRNNFTVTNMEIVKIALRFIDKINKTGSNMIGGNDAYLCFDSLSYDEQANSYAVSFKYACDGIEIASGEDVPIKVIIKDAKIIGVTMHIKNYSLRGDEAIVPDILGAAQMVRYLSDKRPVHDFKMKYEQKGESDLFEGVWWAFL